MRKISDAVLRSIAFLQDAFLILTGISYVLLACVTWGMLISAIILPIEHLMAMAFNIPPSPGHSFLALNALILILLSAWIAHGAMNAFGRAVRHRVACESCETDEAVPQEVMTYRNVTQTKPRRHRSMRHLTELIAHGSMLLGALSATAFGMSLIDHPKVNAEIDPSSGVLPFGVTLAALLASALFPAVFVALLRLLDERSA